MLYFSCSHMLSRDDKMSIKFRASQKTVKWISETQQLPDFHSRRNFQDKYESYNNIDSSRRFTYTKVDYIHIASSLPYTMIEHLLICPCDLFVNNQYWDCFDCSIPFKQDVIMCSKPKRNKNSLQFSNMKGLMKYLKNQKCNHHIIVHKYLTYYLHLKTNQSHISNQLKNVAKHKSMCYYSEKLLYKAIM